MHISYESKSMPVVFYVREITETGSIHIVRAVCVEFGNNDDTWTWCYLDVSEALTKAKELLMKLEPDERLVVGTAYCGQNLRTGEILELVPAEDYLEIGGVSFVSWHLIEPSLIIFHVLPSLSLTV